MWDLCLHLLSLLERETAAGSLNHNNENKHFYTKCVKHDLFKDTFIHLTIKNVSVSVSESVSVRRGASAPENWLPSRSSNWSLVGIKQTLHHLLSTSGGSHTVLHHTAVTVEHWIINNYDSVLSGDYYCESHIFAVTSCWRGWWLDRCEQMIVMIVEQCRSSSWSLIRADRLQQSAGGPAASLSLNWSSKPSLRGQFYTVRTFWKQCERLKTWAPEKPTEEFDCLTQTHSSDRNI